jgi:hypothetical protein
MIAVPERVAEPDATACVALQGSQERIHIMTTQLLDSAGTFLLPVAQLR